VLPLSSQGRGCPAEGAAEAGEQSRRLGEGWFASVRAQDVMVEEAQRDVGHFQAGQRVLLGLGGVLKEAAEVAQAEVARVALVVKEDESASPVGVTLGGPVLAEAGLGCLADEVEQPRACGCTGVATAWVVMADSGRWKLLA